MTWETPSVPVTVLIAARNERATLPGLIFDLRRCLPDPFEILVIDDGSSDGTASAAAEAGARVISLAAHRGKGAALRCGLAEARGSFILTLDADGQDDPNDLRLLLDRAQQGADLVIGSRFLGRFEPGAISRLNHLGTRFFNRLIGILYGVTVTDSQAGVRCFRHDVVERMTLRATEYEIETEMLLQAVRLSARIAEVPVRRLPRKAGGSSFSRVRHGLRILTTILRNRLP